MATEHQSEPALSAARMIDQYGYDLELADSVVLVFDAGLIPARSTTRVQRRATHPFRATGSLGDDVDVVLATGPGAPVAAITIEFLAAFGVNRVIAVGTAGSLGSLSSNNTPASLVIARAESDEGTSAHFGNDRRADENLTATLLDAIGSEPHIALTTDVPFRHTPQRLASHRARADVVEMECAALFAAAKHFKLRCASVLVTSDVFTEDDIWLPLDSNKISRALRNNVQIAARVLAHQPW